MAMGLERLEQRAMKPIKLRHQLASSMLGLMAMGLLLALELALELAMGLALAMGVEVGPELALVLLELVLVDMLSMVMAMEMGLGLLMFHNCMLRFVSISLRSISSRLVVQS